MLGKRRETVINRDAKYEQNETAFRRLKSAIDRQFPRGHCVALDGGEVIADADSFNELQQKLTAAGKNEPEVYVVQAGVDYPESASIQFRLHSGPGAETNFGKIVGGFLRVRMPDTALNEVVLGHAGDSVVQAVQASSLDFEGVAGLPLLRLLEYGGNADGFWVR